MYMRQRRDFVVVFDKTQDRPGVDIFVYIAVPPSVLDPPSIYGAINSKLELPLNWDFSLCT